MQIIVIILLHIRVPERVVGRNQTEISRSQTIFPIQIFQRKTPPFHIVKPMVRIPLKTDLPADMTADMSQCNDGKIQMLQNIHILPLRCHEHSPFFRGPPPVWSLWDASLQHFLPLLFFRDDRRRIDSVRRFVLLFSGMEILYSRISLFTRACDPERYRKIPVNAGRLIPLLEIQLFELQSLISDRSAKFFLFIMRCDPCDGN